MAASGLACCSSTVMRESGAGAASLPSSARSDWPIQLSSGAMRGGAGLMGEAGPEAVMPLHRGPDGSLGVRTSGGVSNDNAAPQQNVTYVINAPGASKADLESVRQTLMALAGPGIVEQRTIAARIRGVAA